MGAIRTATDCCWEAAKCFHVTSCQHQHYRTKIHPPTQIDCFQTPNTRGKRPAVHVVCSAKDFRKGKQDTTKWYNCIIIYFSIELHPTSNKPRKQLSCPWITHFSGALFHCNIIATLGILIIGGATSIDNSMAIIPITISMHISKIMAISIIMVAIAIELAVMH